MILIAAADVRDFPREKLMAASDAETRARAASAFNPRKGETLALGRLLARWLEARLRGLRTCDVVLRHTPEGRPYFDALPEYVSVSHCDTGAMACVSDAPVGCDLQSVRRFPGEAVRGFFAPEDYEAIAAGDAPDELMTRLWTRRECLIKLPGSGYRPGRTPVGDADAYFRASGIRFSETRINGMFAAVAYTGEQETETVVPDLEEVLL